MYPSIDLSIYLTIYLCIYLSIYLWIGYTYTYTRTRMPCRNCVYTHMCFIRCDMYQHVLLICIWVLACACLSGAYVRACISIRLCIHACLHVRMHMHDAMQCNAMHGCMYVCMYVCMYECMYVQGAASRVAQLFWSQLVAGSWPVLPPSVQLPAFAAAVWLVVP